MVANPSFSPAVRTGGLLPVETLRSMTRASHLPDRSSLRLHETPTGWQPEMIQCQRLHLLSHAAWRCHQELKHQRGRPQEARRGDDQTVIPSAVHSQPRVAATGPMFRGINWYITCKCPLYLEDISSKTLDFVLWLISPLWGTGQGAELRISKFYILSLMWYPEWAGCGSEFGLTRNGIWLCRAVHSVHGPVCKLSVQALGQD